jgi:hypothetical protein
LYGGESDLIAVFICAEYNEKEWCGIEWKAIREFMNYGTNDERIMFIKFDNGEVDGVFGTTDGFIDIKKYSTYQIVELIEKRLIRISQNEETAEKN